MSALRFNRKAVRFRQPAVILGTTLATLLAVVVLSRAGSALVVSEPVTSPDAIVTLASHEWERLPLTARVAAQYPEALVLLTLPQEVNEFNCHDCSHRVSRLAHAGVAPGRIRVLPLTSSGTHGEALATLEFARRSPVQRLIIVTSPYHTRRALATFRTIFARTRTMVGIAPASATSPAQPASWWRAPYDRWYVRYEWAAILYYALRYGVSPV